MIPHHHFSPMFRSSSRKTASREADFSRQRIDHQCSNWANPERHYKPLHAWDLHNESGVISKKEVERIAFISAKICHRHAQNMDNKTMGPYSCILADIIAFSRFIIGFLRRLYNRITITRLKDSARAHFKNYIRWRQAYKRTVIASVLKQERPTDAHASYGGRA